MHLLEIKAYVYINVLSTVCVYLLTYEMIFDPRNLSYFPEFGTTVSLKLNEMHHSWCALKANRTILPPFHLSKLVIFACLCVHFPRYLPYVYV